MHFSIRKAKVRRTLETWAKSIPAICDFTAGTARGLYDEDMMFAIHGGAAHRRAPTKKPPAPKGADLLKMFDEGIAEVETWQDHHAESRHPEL